MELPFLYQTVTPNNNVSQAAYVTPHLSKTKKYDLHSIPPDFMMTEGVVSQARALVRHLEREQQVQVTVNELYQKLVNLLTEQMDKHIPFRVRPTDKHISHKPHSARPW